MPPLLSVVVPAYGVGEYLPACLDSILAQTLTDLEVIVVDDGSPDECGEIADDYAAVDERVIVLHTENQGLGPARNEGARVATGKYLTFADSDDLIPPRAYELLVSSLERTGSDIAAGNTWRYIEGKGNVQSWTHAEAFAETRIKTHIREFPTLIRDRMVWNKVFRRSFWDEHGFEFPAIRYEDYPVTLPAHLKATSVDIFTDKVYHWRQRLAENSITQRSLELDNLTDRVVSAELTLDVADAEGGEIAKRIHGYFTDIDVITLATALAEGEEDDRAAIGELGVRLARRLRPSKEWTTPLARNIHAALVRGDLDGAAALAEQRRGGSKADALRTFLRPQRIAHLPGLATDLVLGGVTVPKLKDRRLRSRVMEVTRLDGVTMVQVETRLRRVLLDRATVTVELRSDDHTISLDANVAALNGQRATTEVLIPDTLVERFGDTPYEMMLRITVGPMSWLGVVNIGRGEIPDPVQMASGAWAVVSQWQRGSSALWVRRVENRAMAQVELTDDELIVHMAQEHPFAAVLRPEPSAPLIRPVVDGVARFALNDVLDDPADDPVTSRSYRDLVALSSAAAERVAANSSSTASLVGTATGVRMDGSHDQVGELETDVVPSGVDGDLSAGADETPDVAGAERALQRAGVTPLLLTEYPQEQVRYDDHVVRVRRSTSCSAELQHEIVY
ncbi:glycosyltransferase, partial [uncultured Tessaracoccus sp.]|uniref:glycosyltransferase n=1 Tax=uncultured Tessaracoccus sp. TaxID=905023 RepID=UPI00260A4134